MHRDQAAGGPCLLAALAFGAAAGAFKGTGAGMRDDIGNLSAPWLLLPVLAGSQWPAPPGAVGTLRGAGTLRGVGTLRGAAAGLLATLVALSGFYATVTWLSRGSLGAGGLPGDFWLELRLNGLYFRAGMISGPALGAAGGWLARRRPGLIPMLCGALLAGEILAVAAVQGRPLPVPGASFSWWVSDWRPYLGQTAVGVAVLVFALAQRRRSWLGRRDGSAGTPTG